MISALAALVVIGFNYVSLTQVRDDQEIARESQIADRYNSAASSLGQNALEAVPDQGTEPGARPDASTPAPPTSDQ